MDKMSIVVPCYNEEEAVPVFFEEIIKLESKMNKKSEVELVFIDDGSHDRTLEVVRELSNKDKRVRYLSFSRHYGSDACIMAGLEASNGDFVAIMNINLQEHPALLEEMYDILKKGVYDSVATCNTYYNNEKHGIVLNKLKVRNEIEKCNLRMMTRQMTNSIVELKEYSGCFNDILSIVGYNTKWLEYKNLEIGKGKDKRISWSLIYNLLVKVLSKSTVSLQVTSVLSIIISLIVVIILIFIVCKTLFVSGDFSFFPFFISLISGIQLFCVGIMGCYLSGRCFEVKKRPLYIIKETEDVKKNERKNK